MRVLAGADAGRAKRAHHRLMAEDDARVPGTADRQPPRDEERLASGEDQVTSEGCAASEGDAVGEDHATSRDRGSSADHATSVDRPTQVAVVEVGGSPAVQWRR